MQYDFGGYATRNDIRCTDGRTIRKNAFKDNNGQIVPLVWQHNHDSPENVLGHGLLENRDDGVYVYGTFNDSEAGRQAKELVQHGDITRLSIYANRLKENDHNVVHGNIREVSLVFAGANDGAYIDKVSFQHADGTDGDSDEAIIYSGEDLQQDVSLDIFHSDDKSEQSAKPEATETQKEEPKMAEKERTIGDVVNEMTDEQRKVLEYLVGTAAAGAAGDDDDDDEPTAKHYDYGDDEMKYNVFEDDYRQGNALMHKEEVKEMEAAIFADAKRCGSLKESFLAHAAADTNGVFGDGQNYGIKDIDVFFPEVKNLSDDPNIIQRDAEWVSTFMNGTKKSPFSRIKITNIDITKEAARALGYSRGKKKKEEVILALKRTTEPTTIYKKQMIDHQDLLDITDFKVVNIIKSEMRTMLNEEVARAALLGDGRENSSDDKIDETKIRPIVSDDETYCVKVPIVVNPEKTPLAPADIIDAVIRSRKFYKGSGNPTMFTTEDILADMLLSKDDIGHYLYKSASELATVLRVKSIVTVPVMENFQRELTGEESVAGQGEVYKKFGKGSKSNVLAIIVNPNDYTFGSDNGSDIEYFDDFDIDYNQHKYLMETRCSGSLTKPFSALVIEELRDKGGDV